jgi:hypothetical protein
MSPCDVHVLWRLRENVVAFRPNPIRDGPNLHIEQAVRLPNDLKDRNANGTESAWLEARS